MIPNPLLSPWKGPHGGVPAFADVQVIDFKPAVETAIAERRAEIHAILRNPEKPTFENTVVALEKAGRKLKEVLTYFGVWSTSLSTPDFQEIEADVTKAITRSADEIVQNAELFARVDAVFQEKDSVKLTPEQRRLLVVTHDTFVRSGAKMDPASKKRVATINERLAELFTQFSQNVLGDESHDRVVLESPEDLVGLPESLLAAAAVAAKALGMEGKWVITNTRSSVEPFLTYAARRDLREQVWRNFMQRGDNANERNNNKIISEILKLRAERAKLLGYATHAHWRLEDSMAKTPARALALLETMWKPAVARVAEEVRDMQAIADREGAKTAIAPWDYRFYAEKVRKAKYDLDENELTPYLQLDNLRQAMFWLAEQNFGFTFHPVTDVPVFHSDVSVYEVKDRHVQHVGLWYFDPYARAGKRSGAWMSTYRDQEHFEQNITPLVSNNSNFARGEPGKPVLVSWQDAVTAFHEFGHALHALSSNVSYPSLSGTNVARDFVEFPSQLNENWLSTPEILNRFARHVDTGMPMPAELIEKIKNASRFNQGFATIEYLSSALIDMKLHMAVHVPEDASAFERETLEALGMPKEMVMRHRTPQFMHIFSDDGYSAGYYSYLWADTLTADFYEAFLEGKGPYDSEVAARYQKHALSVGNTLELDQAYRNARGRDPDPNALMRKRGFAVTP